MRNLVVCCDGTWNSPQDKQGGIPVPTNVVRLYNALAENDESGNAQLKYYHPGVGTDGNIIKRMLEGGIGMGLDRNISSAYRWLASHYQFGDRIFLFGFSRGAFTVRSLGGMLNKCGLLDLAGLENQEAWSRVQTAYKKYRNRVATDIPGHWLHKGNGPDGKVPIHFIGVWDTVGALGIPDDLGILDLLDFRQRHHFHDTSLSNIILNARHAVALDEKRASFTPTLWSGTETLPHVKQIWFPGVHCDVGGGYAEKGLSDGALKWMMDEAADLHLAFIHEIRSQVGTNPQDVLHDSGSGIFKLFKAQPRSIPLIAAPASGVLHNSVLLRQKTPPIAQAPYRPAVLLQPGGKTSFPVYAAQHWNDTGIYLEAGAQYAFQAQGEWLDKSIKCGPAGPHKGFQLGKLAYFLASIWGIGVKVFRLITGRKRAKLGMRRQEDMPWFALVGSIANGGNPQEDGTPTPPEAFLIGEGCTYRITNPGYLYCFANDIWGIYGNNRGSVMLTVSRLT